jgi:hypothetical protein
MRRVHSTVLAFGVAVLACAVLPGRADESASIDQDIAVLNDVHAGSNQKMVALRNLQDIGPIKDPTQNGRALAALARQARFDLGAVRTLAYGTLIARIGGREDTRPAPGGASFDLAFRKAIPEWTVLGNIEDYLASSPSEAPGFVIRHLAALAERNPRLFEALSEPLKARLALDLEIGDRDQPSARLQTLKLLSYLGPMRASTFPVVLRGLGDEDAKARALARMLLTEDLGDLDEPMRDSIAGALTDRYRPISSEAKSLIGPHQTKSTIAAAVAQAVQDGDLSALKILKDEEIDLRLFADEVMARLRRANSYNRRLLLNGLRQAGLAERIDDFCDLREALVDLLAISDDDTAVAVAGMLTTRASREIANDALVSAIKKGHALSPAMLKALKPDAEKFGQLLIEPMLKEELETKQSAVEALAATGAEGAAVRAVLTEILRNPDPALRHTAARALNTPEAFARAGLPELLQDLRNESVSIRQVAAREFDGLQLEPKEFTTAVIRAVDQRDMPAREGLIAAMTWANLRGQNPIEVLKESAAKEPDVTRRVYARAALREVESSAKPPKEKVP